MKTLGRVGLLALLTGPLLVAGLANHGFWLPDEPFVAEVAREAAVSGDWAVPRLNGEPFLEKPPLHYVAVAACYRALGVTPFAARLPSAIAALLTVIATYFLGVRLLDEGSAFWAAVLLPTVYLFFHAAHYCLVDSTFVLPMTIGFLAAAHALGPDPRPWAVPALYAAAALAFLDKGPVGPGLLGVSVAVVAVSGRDWRFFLRPAHLPGIAVFVAVIAPWVARLSRVGGERFLREALLVNSVGRFVSLPGMVPAGDSPGTHVFPFYDYLVHLPSNFLPWSPLLGLAVLAAIRGRLAGHRCGWGERFLWISSIAGFVALSAASTKRGVYSLPLYPLLALLVAQRAKRLAEAGRPLSRVEWVLLVAQVGVVGLVGLGVAAALYAYSGPLHGAPASLLSTSASVGLAVLALAGVALLARLLLRGRIDLLMRGIWIQAAASFVAFLVLCVPLLERENGFGSFFPEAVRIERERQRTPLLFTGNESYLGLAGLSFERVLPRLALANPPGRGEEVDVLTDRDGLAVLRAAPGSSVTVLLGEGTRGLAAERILYLVTFSRNPHSHPAAP